MWSICHSLSHQLLWFSTTSLIGFSAQLPAPIVSQYSKAQALYSFRVVKRHVERSVPATERLTTAPFHYFASWFESLSSPIQPGGYQASLAGICCRVSHRIAVRTRLAPLLWVLFQTFNRGTGLLMTWVHFLVLGWYLFNSLVRVTLGMINTWGQSSAFDRRERLS